MVKTRLVRLSDALSVLHPSCRLLFPSLGFLLRVKVRSSAASTAAAREGGEESKGSDQTAELDMLAEEDEALELISGSVRRQVEAEVFVPVMTR